MTIDEIIKRQKEHLTNAQIKALAQAAERYKQLHAANRADAYNTLHTGLRATQRGLQNVGLASRKGKLISGQQDAANIRAQSEYKDYSTELNRITDLYVQRDAARMAAENIEREQAAALARYKRQQEEYKRRLIEIARARQERDNQQRIEKGNTWNREVTDTGTGSGYNPALHTPNENRDFYQHVAESNGLKGEDATRYANELYNRQLAENARLQQELKIRQAQASNMIRAMTDTGTGDATLNRFAHDYGVTANKITNPETASAVKSAVTSAYKEIDEKTAAWEKKIAAGEAALKDGKTYYGKSEVVQEMNRARSEMANAYSTLARMSVAAENPGIADLILMDDDQFAVAYDAAQQATKEKNYSAGYNSGAYQYETQAREGRLAAAEKTLARFVQAEYARNLTSKDAYRWNLVENDAPEINTFGKSMISDVMSVRDPREYDKANGTEDSLYSAIINEYAPTLDNPAYWYTAPGKMDEWGSIDSPARNRFIRTVNDLVDYKPGITKDEAPIAKLDKMKSVLAAAHYMTDDERDRFNTILDKYGAKDADAYFEYLYNNVLPARINQAVDVDYDAMFRRETEYDDYGNRTGAKDSENTWVTQLTSSMLSVPLNLAEGLVNPIRTIARHQQDPVAARLNARKYGSAQEVRNAVQENFSETGRFLYGTGMSMLDSAAVAAISGGLGSSFASLGMPAKWATRAGSVIGGSLLGGSAFNSSYQEALQRGLSPDKARATALGNGINEMLFESLSLDLLVSRFKTGDIVKVSEKAWKNWLVNTLIQGGVEGSEEVFTDLANRAWDNVVNGIYSEEMQKLREYMDKGMTYEEAKRKVKDEYNEQLGMSFLGGAVSGGVMGGGASFLGMLQGHDVAKIGRNLDDAAKAEIREYDFKNEEAKEILTGKLTDEDYGRLAMTRLEEMAQTDPVAAEKAAQALIDATARTDVKVDKRNQTLKTGTENTVSFNYDGVTDVKKMSGVQVEALRFAQTLVKSKVGGVNINVANQLYDKNGNEQNGWYDAKTNTVHVSLNGSQSVVYTISHELTHRLKDGNAEAYASLRDAMKSELESVDLTGSDLPEDYSDILGDYLVKDGEQRSAWEALIEYEMDRYAKHGIKLDREAAEEEVVCRACETMLEKSRLISSMVSRNVRSAKKIAKLLASISDDIEALKAEAESRGYEDGSPEKMFIDQYTDIEKIANAWASAMKTVSQEETKKIVKEEGRGGTAFSLKQELRDDGHSLADKSMKYRKAHMSESQHISDEMLEAANKQIHRMAERMLPFLTLKNKKGMTYLPDEVLGKTRFGNSSYGGTSIENTTICFRTLAYIDFTNEIKKQIGRPLTVAESFLASQMLYQIAKEPQCLYCYVSLDRKAYDEQLLSYIKQRDKVVESYNKLSLDERQAITNATRNASKAFTVDIPLYTEFLAGRKDTVPMRTRFAQWIDIANSGSEAITAADLATDERRGLMRNGDDWQETKRTTGKVSLQDQVIDAERYAQGASWAKKMEEYRAYNGDILSIGKRTVNKLNHEYGLRFYSFSEYTPAFIVENMQQIRDAALKGLMGLAYTKKTDFARIFAGTGMNINISTFGRWGVDADGNRVVVMDADQGADWTEVQNLRKQFDNVGGVFVATDDAMTEWAMKQDWIDVAIPFHIVRTGANVAEFYKWVVHNNEQNDVTAEGKNATIPAAEHGNSYEKYMKLCEDRGLTPRFNKWNPKNNPNVTEDEYMKLVNETRRTLDETNPLQPVYNTKEAARSFGRFVHDGGYYGDYYKAKSEQDIKVPITPEQDILGIGSQTYSEQEGIDRVVADIKAGNKANQVPYGRQDIDEQISRLNKARQMKQHGQKFSIKESDREYMSLASKVKDGTATDADKAELRKQVDEAAKAAGYRIKAYHGTYRFGRTKFTSQYGALFLSSNPDVGQAFSGDQPVRAISKQANPDTMDIDEAARWYKQNVHSGEFRVATDADFKHEIERLQPLPESVRQKYNLSEEEEARKDKALKKVESKYSRFLNGEKFYYYEYNGINHDYANSPFADVNDFRNVVRERLVKNDNGGGVYEMYISPKNMITVDANGAYYASIPLPSELRKYATAEEKRIGKVTSDQLVRIAYEAGYDTLEIKNVVEGGDYGRTAKATDYVVMNPESQAKSADIITKDDNGNIIPLSERFKTDRTGEEAWKNEDIRYSIRGRNALYSEIGSLDSTKIRDKKGKENLNIAYRMEREGIDSEKIRLATGWFKGYDGKWRNEIDDSGAKLADWLVLGKGIRYMEEKADKSLSDLRDKIISLEDRLKNSNKVNGSDSEQSKALRKELRKTRKQKDEARDFYNRMSNNRLNLSDILDHPKLYENYPQLKDVAVHLTYRDRTGGYLGMATGTSDITLVTDLNSKDEILETLMHEVQHIIQGIEGFAKGANVEYWADRNKRESADVKKAKDTLAQVERDLSRVKYEGNPQASPLKTAVMYAYMTDLLRKDKPGTASYAYDTEQKEKYEKRAEEGGYSDLLKKYLFAYQDVKVAEMEAKDYNKAFADYQRTAGEVEARDVASRLRMSEDERKATRPDIDRKDVTFFEDDNLYNERSRYSIKDESSDKLGGKEYLKYLQLGAKVVNQTATEAEIKEFKQRMNQLSEDNRMGFLDKLREKLIRADEAAKVREVRDRQIARLKEEFRESREKMKEAKIRRDIITVLKKGNDRIVKMLANPTENSHVPVQLAQTVSEYAIALNDILTKSEPRTGENAGKEKQTQKGQLNFNKLIRVYNQTFADQATIEQAARENPGFDPRGKYLDVTQKDESLLQMLNDMNEIVQDKRLSDLDSYELQMLFSTMRGVIHTVQEANKQIVRGEHVETYKRGDRMTEQIESAPKVWGRAYLNETLDLRRLALIYSGSDENAEFVQLVKELNEGAKERARVDQVLTGMFTDLTTKYGKELRGWYGKDAEWIDTGIVRNGKKIEITKGMRVSLAMHVQNSGNMRHITNGGVTIPNRELYRKGKLKDAYAHGNTVALSESEVNEIISHMTEAERAYVEVANEFFHKRAGYYINRTSLQLLGYAKAIVDNYFPIHSDANYLQTNWGDIMRSGSVEGWGSLKERREASNAIYLEDITSVVNRQIRGVALYAGLAIPVRNWRAVLNSTVWAENEDGVWSPRTTVQKALTQRMGSHGMDVLEGFLTDVQEASAVQSTGFDKWLAKVQTNYVKSVLLGNAKVALKQLASIPTANYIIPWKYLLKGMFSGKADTDIMSDYTSLWKLRESNNATEITSIMREQGLEAKMPWLLGWITGMDKWATKRLWKACELMVADEGKYPIGSDAYYKAVGNLWDDVIQQTQPNFTPLQRADMLRGTSLGKGKEIAHSLTLFGTQRMQNGGILIESLFELKNSKGKSVEAQKKARVKFAKAVTSQIVQNVMLVAIGFIVDALRGRMKAWQDDKDKKVTLKSVAKYAGDQFIGNALGSFLGGSEVKDALTVFVKRMVLDEDAYDVELTVPTVETLETMFAFFTSDLPKYIKYMTNDKYTAEEKMRKSHKFTIVLARAAGYVTGLPFENAVKDMFNGINPALQDLIDWANTGELNPWLHQSGKLDSSKTAANYKEWTNDGKKGSTYLYWEKKWKEISKDKTQPNADSLASKLMADRDLTPEEKATLYRMLGGDLVQEGSVVYHPLTVNQKYLKDKEHGTIAVDFTNYSRYQMSQMDDAKYNGFMKAVEMGVPEDLAVTAYRNYASAKKYETRRGVDAKDSFHDWLFKMVGDPAQRAILDMQVVGSAKSVKGSIGYKANGDVYADYSTKATFDAYVNGKNKTEKAEAVSNLEGTPQQKAEAFASMYGYTAKDGIVYNDKGVVQADYTSDEAYTASQMGSSHYEKYTTAVKQGMSKENALKAVEMHKEIMNDEDKDNSTQATKWIFSEYKNANDRAIAGSMFTTKAVTVKDGRTYDEDGYIYRDYTSVAWYKLSNRTLSKDGTNKRYETAQTLTKQGYTAEQIIATYVELDKLSKKSEWKKYLKDHGYTDEQINLFLWSRGWAK